MISLLYLSSAVKKMDEGELLELLHKSEQNNKSLGVTGL
ncbi:MAG: BLUF domain-containing protein, partial [Anaerolineae bacterium]|nr:BLUF domain-containing protein [Anaerolineae bacterium]